MPTKIEWAEESWNPVIGCSKISPGCANCYAERLANRLRHMEKNRPIEKRYYTNVVAPSGWNGSIHLIPDRLDQPLHWKKPRRIFVCSMGDLFHEDVPDEFIVKAWKTMLAAPQHIFLILTKRPTRLLRMVGSHDQYRDEVAPSGCIIRKVLPKNIWLGVTAENQAEADKRIPILLQIPAAKRFVSIEPMLGAVKLYDVSDGVLDGVAVIKSGGMTASTPDSPPEGYDDSYSGLDWVIVGAESGAGRRECKNERVRDIVGQCQAAGIPAFVKQLHINGKLSKNPSEWPEDLRVREYPHD